MTAIGTAPERLARPRVTPRLAIYSAMGVYSLIVAVTILRHEPWADEAQAWLLARDASLATLWTKLLHYEGAPGLWQTLLHVLMRAGLTYSGYKFVGGILGLTGTWLLLRYSSFPLYIRVLLPFTYYLCYQYSVINRSYALLAPLLFGCAAMYQRAERKPALFTVLLSLIAGISVHGVVISGAIALAVSLRVRKAWTELSALQRRRLIVAGSVYVVVLMLLMISAWPAKDVAFAEQRGLKSLTFARFEYAAKISTAEAFTGEWITSLGLLALCLPFLRRGRALLIFVAVISFFWIFGTVVYSQLWHYGMVWEVWLFAMWIAAGRAALDRKAQFALLAMIAVQCWWTFAAVRYDWKYPYSGSVEAARYFHQQPPSPGGLYATGYRSTALQPYFSANLFSNFHAGGKAAYWDWSNRNTANDPYALFSSPHREQVLVGYRELPEREYWATVLTKLQYELVRHFDGNLIWRTKIFEPEAYDLYQRTGDNAEEMASSLQMGDTASGNQLLDGFHAVESGAWRWTARRFSAALGRPAGAQQKGARLVLRFFLPDTQIDRLGPMTLSADIDGYPLGARTFAEPGNYEYSATVPAEALRANPVAVNFRFDKAGHGRQNDIRELAAVAMSIALEPNP